MKSRTSCSVERTASSARPAMSCRASCRRFPDRRRTRTPRPPRDFGMNGARFSGHGQPARHGCDLVVLAHLRRRRGGGDRLAAPHQNEPRAVAERVPRVEDLDRWAAEREPGAALALARPAGRSRSTNQADLAHHAAVVFRTRPRRHRARSAAGSCHPCGRPAFGLRSTRASGGLCSETRSKRTSRRRPAVWQDAFSRRAEDGMFCPRRRSSSRSVMGVIRPARTRVPRVGPQSASARHAPPASFRLSSCVLFPAWALVFVTAHGAPDSPHSRRAQGPYPPVLTKAVLRRSFSLDHVERRVGRPLGPGTTSSNRAIGWCHLRGGCLTAECRADIHGGTWTASQIDRASGGRLAGSCDGQRGS